jgi:hypothetical protein
MEDNNTDNLKFDVSYSSDNQPNAVSGNAGSGQAPTPEQPTAPTSTTPPTPQPDPQPSTPSTTPPTGGALKKVVGILAIALALFVLGGAAYYFLLPSPSRVMAKMAKQFPDIKSARFGTEYSVTIKGPVTSSDSSTENGLRRSPATPTPEPTPQEFTVAAKTNIAVNAKDLKNPKLGAALDVTVKTGGESYRAAGELRTLGQTGYGKIDEIPSLGDLTGELETIKGLWIKFDLDQQESQGSSLTQEQLDKIRDAIRNSQAVKITKSLKSEQLDGQAMYHYQYAISKDALVDTLAKLAETTGEKPSADDIAKAKNDLKDVQFKDGEIWIGKKDLLPHKLTLGLEASNKEMGSLTLTTTTTLKDVNKDVSVTAPEKWKTLEEVERMISGDSDEDGLSLQEEQAYGTDPNKADTDGDGFKDGDEVNRGFNPKGPGRVVSPNEEPLLIDDTPSATSSEL